MVSVKLATPGFELRNCTPTIAFATDELRSCGQQLAIQEELELIEEFNRMRPYAAHLPGNVPTYSVRIQADRRNLAAVLNADDVGAITRGHVALHIEVLIGLSFEGRILQWNLSGLGSRRGQQRISYQHGPYA